LAGKAETTTKNLFILYEVPLPGSVPPYNHPLRSWWLPIESSDSSRACVVYTLVMARCSVARTKASIANVHTNRRTPQYIYILYRSSGTILLCFPLPVVGISSNGRPLCTSDIYHPVLIHTVRIDVKANTTISVRRPKSNDIPGGDLEKMIDGTYTDRVCCYNIMLYIYIYITTIVRAPDVGNQ